jgi:DNA-binding CsgD family transcriptional regulator
VTEWTAPQTDELRRLVKAGYSNAEIARRFGMTPSAVREKCRRIGIRRLRHRTKSLTQNEALAELEMVAKVIRQRKD